MKTFAISIVWKRQEYGSVINIANTLMTNVIAETKEEAEEYAATRDEENYPEYDIHLIQAVEQL